MSHLAVFLLCVVGFSIAYSTDPCKQGDPSNCRGTTASVGCPKITEFFDGPRFETHYCCCRCPNGTFTRKGEPKRIRCHKRKKVVGTTTQAEILTPTKVTYLPTEPETTTPTTATSAMYQNTTTSLLVRFTSATKQTVSKTVKDNKNKSGSGGVWKEASEYEKPIDWGNIVIFSAFGMFVAAILVFALVCIFCKDKLNPCCSSHSVQTEQSQVYQNGRPIHNGIHRHRHHISLWITRSIRSNPQPIGHSL